MRCDGFLVHFTAILFTAEIHQCNHVLQVLDENTLCTFGFYFLPLSAALSIKMNILVLLPAYATILLMHLGLLKSIANGFLFLLIQVNNLKT